MKSLKIVLIVAAIAGAVTLYIFLSGGDSVAVTHPVRGPAVQAVYATGTVEPIVMIPLAPRATGRLLELFSDEGHEVEKGQVLAQLEDENLRKTLAELQARADLAQKEYDRKSGLARSGAVSKESADQALADRDAAIAAVERAQAELDYLKLIAPESGTVIRRDGEIGEVITAGQPVFWMACCAGLRVEAEVDEEDIALVQPGQKAVIRADAFPGEIFHGAVSSITPKGDPVARSYRVRVGLESDSKLMIGMTAETNIIIREEVNALLVPASAVTGQGTVYAVREGKAVEVKVKTGARTTRAVEILEGLSEEDLIVRDAAQEIAKGENIPTSLEQWEAP